MNHILTFHSQESSPDTDLNDDELEPEDNCDQRERETKILSGNHASSNKDTGADELDSTGVTSLIESSPEHAANPNRIVTDTVNTKNTESNVTEKAREPSRIRFNDRRFDERGLPVVVAATIDTSSSSKEAPADNVEEKIDYAFTWSRGFDTDNKYLYTEVEIQSKTLAELLKASLTHHMDFPHHDRVIRLRSPFKAVVHNWTKLLDEAKPHLDEDDEHNTAREDLKRLMDQVSSSTELKQYFRDLDPSKPSETVSFELLWTIFPPGCLVYSKRVMQKDQVLILQNLEEEEVKGNRKRVTLTCWAYDWDGEFFNRVPYDLYIEYFKGTTSINTLDCFPIEHHRDRTGLRTRLINRGKKYRELCIRKTGAQMFDYNGPTIED